MAVQAKWQLYFEDDEAQDCVEEPQPKVARFTPMNDDDLEALIESRLPASTRRTTAAELQQLENHSDRKSPPKPLRSVSSKDPPYQ